MSTELSLTGGSFAEMAAAMGMNPAAEGTKSTLARLRLWHQPVMGEVEVKGKTKKMEVVEGGMYRLDVGGEYTYAPKAIFRPFMQRYLYKKFDSSTNSYTKTVMGNDLNTDLKDDNGGFNCGKPAGYIEDFKALSKDMQDLIKSIKRVRAVFGVVELVDAVDGNGEHVDVEPTPVIWEVENKDAFKSIGALFNDMARMRSLPPQHKITFTVDEGHSMPNGAMFFLPVAELDRKQMPLDTADEETFRSFMEWVQNYNEYIVNAFNEKHVVQANAEDADLVEDFIDVELGE